ncbi:MAG: tRNA (5-methylaminomethyl-2-thiouridine)(34)-methyltransferase MnmD [Bacteroidetes bacterium]|nr:tRNA (5-methylaminomethyl-2-thiouridine)(34)-methyltransferase MnmD [Bacteroidota bacterium]
MERKIITTGDGSKTIQLVDWNEQYHSIHGAIQEAKHVFLTNFLKFKQQSEQCTIFEMGFGTGLNAFLTSQVAKEKELKVKYHSLEAYPVQLSEIKELNYREILQDSLDEFTQLHTSKWDEPTLINPFFQLKKIQQTLEVWENRENYYDFIFYDAFGPRVQPHLWTTAIFEKIYSVTKCGGVFLTYCAKGQVRRDLESVGYKISRLPGPPGKREMLMGVKPIK